MSRPRNPYLRRKHRIVLDVTFDKSITETDAINHMGNNLDTAWDPNRYANVASVVKVTRPARLSKVFRAMAIKQGLL